jgi:hypothetical protein
LVRIGIGAALCCAAVRARVLGDHGRGPRELVRVTPVYQAIFEDDDPARRVMVLANHSSDLAEYWEYAATGDFPVDPTNDAFRLGINYIVYGVTH